jgi:hypothetical protein
MRYYEGGRSAARIHSRQIQPEKEGIVAAIKAGRYEIKIEARLAEDTVKTPYDATEELLRDLRIALRAAVNDYLDSDMPAAANYFHRLACELRTGKEA